MQALLDGAVCQAPERALDMSEHFRLSASDAHHLKDEPCSLFRLVAVMPLDAYVFRERESLAHLSSRRARVTAALVVKLEVLLHFLAAAIRIFAMEQCLHSFASSDGERLRGTGHRSGGCD